MSYVEPDGYRIYYCRVGVSLSPDRLRSYVSIHINSKALGRCARRVLKPSEAKEYSLLR